MLKAKALCAVEGNADPEIKPLLSMEKRPDPAPTTSDYGMENRPGDSLRGRVIRMIRELLTGKRGN